MRQSRVHRGKNTMKKERTERTNDEGLTKGRRAFLKGAVATSSAAATLGAIGFPHISPARAAHMEPRKIGTSRAMYVSRWHQIYNFSVLDFLLRVDDLAIYCAIKHIDEVLLFHFQDITTENEYRAHGIAVDYLKERSGTVTKIGAVFGSTSDVDNIVKYQTRVASLPGDLPVIEPTTDSNKFDFMVMEYEFWNHEDDPRKPPRSYSDGVARIRYAAKNGGNASSLTLSDPPDPSDRRIEVHSALGFLRDGAMNPERELDQFEVDDLFKHAVEYLVAQQEAIRFNVPRQAALLRFDLENFRLGDEAAGRLFEVALVCKRKSLAQFLHDLDGVLGRQFALRVEMFDVCCLSNATRQHKRYRSPGNHSTQLHDFPPFSGLG